MRTAIKATVRSKGNKYWCLKGGRGMIDLLGNGALGVNKNIIHLENKNNNTFVFYKYGSFIIFYPW